MEPYQRPAAAGDSAARPVGPVPSFMPGTASAQPAEFVAVVAPEEMMTLSVDGQPAGRCRP